MQSNANERLQVRNMSNVAHSSKNNDNGEGKQERGNSLNHPHNDKKLVNTWVSAGF